MRARVHFVKRRIGDRNTRMSPGLHNASTNAWRLLSQLKSLHASSGTPSALREEAHSTSAGRVKRFRVICSHLHPNSVVHMYGELGRPSVARDIPHPQYWYSYTSSRKKTLDHCHKTFRYDDDSKANILTCNCSCSYEPKQIDHILSSDVSLRSRTFDSSATK